MFGGSLSCCCTDTGRILGIRPRTPGDAAEMRSLCPGSCSPGARSVRLSQEGRYCPAPGAQGAVCLAGPGPRSARGLPGLGSVTSVMSGAHCRDLGGRNGTGRRRFPLGRAMCVAGARIPDEPPQGDLVFAKPGQQVQVGTKALEKVRATLRGESSTHGSERLGFSVSAADHRPCGLRDVG